MPTTISYEEVKQVVEQQLQQNFIGVLATAEGDHVTARQMMLLSNGLIISCFTFPTSRKFKQIESNKKVSIAIGNIQIDGNASIKGRTSDPQNAKFLEAFKKNMSEVYEQYKNEVEAPDTFWAVVEIIPKRIAVFYGRPDAHLDVIHVDEQKAIKYEIPDLIRGDYT